MNDCNGLWSILKLRYLRLQHTTQSRTLNTNEKQLINNKAQLRRRVPV